MRLSHEALYTYLYVLPRGALREELLSCLRQHRKRRRPRSRGEDRRGQPFVISAGSAVQQTSRDPVVKLQDMAARIQMRDGPAHIVAKSGLYDMESETVDVDGPVAVRAAGGYALNTRDVQIDLASRTAHSEGPVTGSMPLGTFSADRIAADIGERTVTLEGRARLHIVQNKVR